MYRYTYIHFVIIITDVNRDIKYHRYNIGISNIKDIKVENSEFISIKLVVAGC